MGPWLWSVALLTVLAAFAWFVSAAPAIVSAGVAVAVACGFSIWLERTAEVDEPPRERRSGTQTSLLLLAVIVLSSVAAFAQQAPNTAEQPTTAPSTTSAKDPLEHIQLGVTLEGYYQYNWNRPHDRVNLLRAYDTRANVFSIQQAAVVLESAPKVDDGRRYGARLDLQFGQATETVQGSAVNEPRPDVYRNVWQAYGTYIFPVGRGLQADFGKFASSLGYETNYAKDNNHFSRAFLFNFLPFYHSGLRLTLPVDDKVTLMYTLTNGIQQTEDFNDFKSNHMVAILKPVKSVTWTVNYYFGQEQPDRNEPRGPDGFFRVFDTYASYSPTAKLSLAADVNYVTNEANKSDSVLSLQGAAGYARYQLSTPAALAIRYERLDDEGLFGGIAQVLQGLTATAEYTFADGFLMRGEFRRDWSNEQFFTGPELGDLRKHQNTLLVGLVWWFGNKAGAW